MSNQHITTSPGEQIVVYLCTRNLYDMLPAAYNSLLFHNPDLSVYIFAEDDSLPFCVPQNIHCVNVSSQTIFPSTGPNYDNRYSYMILLKTALSKFFPSADRVLILDVDTIVHDSISDLWDLDLSDSYYAAVLEPRMSQIKNAAYPNAGVLMLNLSMLRSTHMDDSLITELNTTKHKYPEQDALCKLCGNRFTPLPARYNVSRVTNQNVPDPAVIHYASIQNYWTFPPVRQWLLRSAPSPRSVVYIGNRNVYSMMLSSAKSLLCHSPVDHIYFLIEDDAFPEPLPHVFRTINVSDQTFFPPSCPNILPYYSVMTTLRAALSKILPSEDRVLLLDPDTVVMDDISGVWNYNISEHFFAAVQETRNNDHIPPYYNAGVMYMNLKLLRETGMDDRIIHTINTTHYKHLEQDVLNLSCADHILPLPSQYNASFVSDPCPFPRIMHFLDKAKQFFPEAAQKYTNLPWDMIPFANTKGDT